jgi:hypothetical protein
MKKRITHKKLAECEKLTTDEAGSSEAAAKHPTRDAFITVTVSCEVPGTGDAVETRTEYVTFVGENAADAAIAYLQNQKIIPASLPREAPTATKTGSAGFSVPRDGSSTGAIWLEAKKDYLRQLGAFMLAEHTKKKEKIFRTVGRALLSIGLNDGPSSIQELTKLWENAKTGTRFANTTLPEFVAECGRSMKKINEMMNMRTNLPHFGHFKNPNIRKVNHRLLGPMAGDNPLPSAGKEKTATTDEPKAPAKKLFSKSSLNKRTEK